MALSFRGQTSGSLDNTRSESRAARQFACVLRQYDSCNASMSVPNSHTTMQLKSDYRHGGVGSVAAQVWQST